MGTFIDAYKQNTAVAPRTRSYDFNVWDRTVGNVSLGAQEALTSTLFHVFQQKRARSDAESSGASFIKKEEHESQFPDIEFKKNEYAAETELRYQYHINRSIHERKTRGSSFLGSLAAGMVGNTAMPLDLALAFVPAGMFSNAARSAALATRRGKHTFTRTRQVLRRLESMDAGVKRRMLTKRAIDGKSNLLPLTAKAAKAGFAEQVVENSIVWGGSVYTGRDYGALDFGADMLFGPLLNTTLSSRSILKANKTMRVHGQMIADRRAAQSFYSNNDFSSVITGLRKYNADLNLAVETNPEVKSAMATPLTDQTPEQREVLRQFIMENDDAIWVKEIKGLLPLDPNKPRAEALQEQSDTLDRIIEAKQTGDQSKLAKGDKEILKSAAPRKGFISPLEGASKKSKRPIPADIEKLMAGAERIRAKREVERSSIDDKIAEVSDEMEGMAADAEDYGRADQDIPSELKEEYARLEEDLAFFEDLKERMKDIDISRLDALELEHEMIAAQNDRFIEETDSGKPVFEERTAELEQEIALVQEEIEWVKSLTKAREFVSLEKAEDILGPNVSYGSLLARPIGSVIELKDGQVGILATHASPHRFNSFSIEAVGTGEGVQAYGYGIYFSTNPRVHEDYIYQFGKETASSYVVILKSHPDEVINLDKPINEQSEGIQEAVMDVIGLKVQKFTSLDDEMLQAVKDGNMSQEDYDLHQEYGDIDDDRDFNFRPETGYYIVKSKEPDSLPYGPYNSEAEAEKASLPMTGHELQASSNMSPEDLSAELYLRGLKGYAFADGYSRKISHGGYNNYVLFSEEHLQIMVTDNAFNFNEEPADIDFSTGVNNEFGRKKLKKAFKILDNEKAFNVSDIEWARITLVQASREHHAEIVKAHRVIEEIFGFQVKLDPKRLEYDPNGDTDFGEAQGDRIAIAELRTFMSDPNFQSPSQVVFHEAFHTLRETNPDVWNKVSDIIRDEPMLVQKLNDILVQERNYDPSKVMEERPSVLMEWMIGQKEFWSALEAKDKTLYQKFLGFINRMIQDVVNRLNLHSANLKITPDDLSKQTPAELASTVGRVLAEAKKVNRAADSSTLNKSSKPKADAEVEASAQKMDKEMETKGQEATQRQVAKEETEAGEVPKRINPFRVGVKAAFNKLVPLAAQTAINFKFKAKPDADGNIPKYDSEEFAAQRDQAFEETLETQLDEMQMEGRARSDFKAFLVTSYRVRLYGKKMQRISMDVFSRPDVPAEIMSNKGMFDIYSRIQYQVDQGTITSAEASAQFNESITDYVESTLLGRAHDLAILRHHDHLHTESKNPLKYLKTILDGRARKGVRTHRAGIHAKQLVQIQQDQAALRHVLNKHGLMDVFNGVSTVGMQATLTPSKLHKTKNAEAQRVYDENLEKTSDQFWKDLTEAVATDTVPKHWEGQPAFLEVLQAFKDTNASQMSMLNEMGANIHFLEGHTGIAQRWDETAILKQGYPTWAEDMRENIDWDATERAHGGVMNVKIGPEGQVMSSNKFDPQKFLESWWTELNSTERVDAEPNISASFSKSRQVVMKKGTEIPMMQKYSGHRHMGQLYLDQVRYRSEMITMAQNFGSKPLENFDKIAERIGVEKVGNSKIQSKLGQARQGLDYKHMRATMEHLTGSLDNPVNKPLSGMFQKLRQVSNLAFLPMSGVSAITDIPMITSTLQQMGVDVGTLDTKFWKQYIAANKRNFKGDQDAMRTFYEGVGAGMDAYMNAASRRIAVGNPNDTDFMGKMNNALFNINYLNGITQAGQEAYVDILTQSIARQIADGKFHDRTIATMESFGISEADMASFKDAIIETPDGVKRFDPSQIKDAGVARKVREYMMHFMQDAVLTPDAGAQAMVRMGLQAGTWEGEAVRTLFQYMSFPLAMTRSTTRRFLLDHNGSSAWTSHQTGMVHMMSFAGSMLAMAYMATVIKDLARGKKPIMLYDMTSFDSSRLMAQSGLLGIMEGFTGGVRGTVAPLPYTLGKAALSTSKEEVARDLRPLLGGAYPFGLNTFSKELPKYFGEAITMPEYRD